MQDEKQEKELKVEFLTWAGETKIYIPELDILKYFRHEHEAWKWVESIFKNPVYEYIVYP